ncbi:HAD-IA family hydrolase [Oceanicola sp. S124]|uniref:HAD-IA family hydrolase n=1 Tax=Oceanicola sp. S124 TaxID=1042378 RepID=UPI000255A410|nr:HAD-IA family hydrolase [Oceanicola sp. S124]
MSDLRLVIFDVDGTLSDSLGEIRAAMAEAFDEIELTLPSRDEIKRIIGLSLDQAMVLLAPEVPASTHARLVAAYKAAYQRNRLAAGPEHSPLFPGMKALVRRLAGEDETLLAVATGKSRRGLEALLDVHGLRGYFQSIQVADDHPSKPHPSMILTALAETGVAPARAVMIGDTRYDIDMAQAAGVASIAVGWGYHPLTEMTHSSATAETAEELAAAIDRLTGETR